MKRITPLRSALKSLLLLIALLGSSVVSLQAQSYYQPMQAPHGENGTSVEAPAVVEAALKALYPKAINVFWVSEFAGSYTASFIDTSLFNVTFDTVGNIETTEIQMTPKQLSAQITSSIGKRYPGWTVMNARAVLDDKKTMTFNALIQREDKSNSYELTYDQQGNFICSSPPLPKIDQ